MSIAVRDPQLEDAADLPVELGVVWAETARVLRSSRSSAATLQRIVDAAVSYVDACDAASVSMRHDAAVDTPAWTDLLAVDVDTLQYAAGHGPCLDAITKEGVIYADDIGSDMRWPALGPRAAQRGARSVLSVRLGTDCVLGSLNFYACRPGAYPLEQRTKALVFAGHAGVAAAAAKQLECLDRELAAERRRFNALQRAMRSHAVVAMAEGILMDQQGLRAADAFAALRRAALQTGREVADVASYVVSNRRLPGFSRSDA